MKRFILVFGLVVFGVGIAVGNSTQTLPEAATAPTFNSSFDVSYEGSFSYDVPFRIPEFRGLEPNLGLSYTSTGKVNAAPQNIVGLGWRLTGLSSIERVSEYKGAARFSNGNDVFLLDGQELLACADDAATAPYEASYPDRMKSTASSASCLAGGNMTTLRENDQKIVAQWQEGRLVGFEIVAPNGTKRIYRSVGELVGLDYSATTDSEHRNLAFNYRWLLTSIEDTQVQPNVVEFEYAFDTKGNSYTERPSHIRYAGYDVAFHYDARPMASFANGTTYLGTQNYRLSAVTMQDGETPIRAYDLIHTDQDIRGTDLVSEVREFGSDYELPEAYADGATPSTPVEIAGTSLPAWTFEYADNGLSYEIKDFPEIDAHTLVFILDRDANGFDDLTFREHSAHVLEYYDEDDNHSEYNTWSVVGGTYQFDATGSLIEHDLQDLPPSHVKTYRSSQDISRSYSPKIYFPMGTQVPWVLESFPTPYRKSYWENGRENLRLWGDTIGEIQSALPISDNCVFIDRVDGDDITYTSGYGLKSGNYDHDSYPEILFGTGVYDILEDGTLSRKPNITIYGNKHKLGNTHYACEHKLRSSQDYGEGFYDIDGDGKTEWLSGNKIYDLDFGPIASNARTMNSVVPGGTYTYSGLYSGPNRSYAGNTQGDINGDGKPDSVFYRRDKRTGCCKKARIIDIAMSNGNGFEAGARWMRHWYAISDVDQQPQILDINQDGLGDLV